MNIALSALVAVAVFASSASAQTSTRERGWLDVNFGIAVAAQDSVTQTFTSLPDRGGEQETYLIGYNVPTGASFDVGGGVMFTNTFGLGVIVQGTASESPADLSIRIPHPAFNNRFANDATETDGKLMRTEGTVHISAMFKAPIRNDKVRVRFYGGPSYFWLTADAVSDITYNQQWNLAGANVVDIRTYDTTGVEQTGWGFHAGGDFAYMFTRVFGLGGFVRYSRGSVEIDDSNVPADGSIDVTTGGLTAGGGIRLRF